MRDELVECRGIQASPRCLTVVRVVVVAVVEVEVVVVETVKGVHYLEMIPAGHWLLVRLPASAECYLRSAAGRRHHPEEL